MTHPVSSLKRSRIAQERYVETFPLASHIIKGNSKIREIYSKEIIKSKKKRCKNRWKGYVKMDDNNSLSEKKCYFDLLSDQILTFVLNLTLWFRYTSSDFLEVIYIFYIGF
jgi:hypothetical protein